MKRARALECLCHDCNLLDKHCCGYNLQLGAEVPVDNCDRSSWGSTVKVLFLFVLFICVA